MELGNKDRAQGKHGMTNIDIGATDSWISLTATMGVCRAAQKGQRKSQNENKPRVRVDKIIYDPCMAKSFPRGRNYKIHAVGRLSIVPCDQIISIIYKMI